MGIAKQTRTSFLAEAKNKGNIIAGLYLDSAGFRQKPMCGQPRRGNRMSPLARANGIEFNGNQSPGRGGRWEFHRFLSPLSGLLKSRFIVTVGFTHGYILPPLTWLNRKAISCSRIGLKARRSDLTWRCPTK